MPIKRQPLGLYCHVPFCASTCDFCAFYQEKPKRTEVERYLSAMDFEFAQLPKGLTIDTIFWGGGTPGLLAAKDLERLGCSLLERISEPPLEWTVEMAPSAVKVDKLQILHKLGVNRISMGVQSFDPELLKSLGRVHSPKQIYTAWERIQEVGFAETNLDLIFAIPGQSINQWESDIQEAARLAPTHLSSYCLTFEEDTALYLKLSRGHVSVDEEKELQFYERCWFLLEELGYKQYEISNFAQKGSECIHNTNIWQMHEWIGCGPSAASQYLGERYQRSSSLDQWSSGLERGYFDKSGLVTLNDDLLLTDAIIFGLRMNCGIDLNILQARFPLASCCEVLELALKRLETEDLIKSIGSNFALTHRGRLICDAVGRALIEQSLNHSYS